MNKTENFLSVTAFLTSLACRHYFESNFTICVNGESTPMEFLQAKWHVCAELFLLTTWLFYLNASQLDHWKFAGNTYLS